MLQVIFHGVDRSPAAEADIARRFEALQRFDNNLSECKATITKVGHQGLGEFSVKLDMIVSGGRSVIATENDPDAMQAINKKTTLTPCKPSTRCLIRLAVRSRRKTTSVILID